MYQGSHARAKKHSRIRMNKLAILFMAVIMLIGAAVGTTVAFLVTKTESVVNDFSYGTISTEIIESFDGTTKRCERKHRQLRPQRLLLRVDREYGWRKMAESRRLLLLSVCCRKK